MTEYHIAFCTDNNYLPYCFVTCQSIIDSLDKNIDKREAITFHLIVDNSVIVPDLNNKGLQFSNRNSASVKISFIIHSIDHSLFKDAPLLRGSYGAYYRILLDKIIDKDVGYILYLDADILVRKDIRQLFKSTNLTNSVFAACEDFAIASQSQSIDYRIEPLSSDYKALSIDLTNYINSGVLLINLHEYRKNNISDICISLLKTHSPSLHDQDLLNYVVESKVILGMEWNFQLYNLFLGYNNKTKNYSLLPARLGLKEPIRFCKDFEINAEKFECIANNPAIFHFTYIKPWGTIDLDFKDLPTVRNCNISKFFEEWHCTAKKVTEFNNELYDVSFCQFYNLDFVDCIINHKILANQQSIDKLIIGRKKDKKYLVLSIITLLILQIITFIFLFFK